MTGRPTRDRVAGWLHLALPKKARAEGRRTDELLQLAALEPFVDRLPSSARAGQFVLKGSVLLAAYDARRPTKEVALAARGLANEPAIVDHAIELTACQSSSHERWRRSTPLWIRHSAASSPARRGIHAGRLGDELGANVLLAAWLAEPRSRAGASPPE